MILTIAISIILLSYYFYKRKAHEFVNRNSLEKVKGSNAINLTIIGSISIVIALAIHLIFPFISNTGDLIHNNYLNVLYTAFIEAALLEETVKYLIFLWMLATAFNKTKNHYFIIYCSVLVGLGFATVENLGYVIGVSINGGSSFEVLGVASIRGLFCTGGHMLSALFIGIFAAKGFSKNNRKDLIKYHAFGISLAVLSHGLWNSFVNLDWLVLAVVSLIMLWELAKKMVKKMHDEVPSEHKEINEL